MFVSGFGLFFGPVLFQKDADSPLFSLAVGFHDKRLIAAGADAERFGKVAGYAFPYFHGYGIGDIQYVLPINKNFVALDFDC